MEVKCIATTLAFPSHQESSMNVSVTIGLKGSTNYAQHLSDQKFDWLDNKGKHNQTQM